MISSLLKMDFITVAAYVLAVVLSMSVHEMAHALVSMMFGDPTARLKGRLSLNPFAHVDWTGLMCLLLFGFGWAKPVPIDSRYYKDEKTGIIWTSFAGPIANFLLAFVCLLIYYGLLLLAGRSFGGSAVGSFILNVLYITAIMSVGFGIFNLIPVPPLDGSKVFWSFLPDDVYYKFIQGAPWMYMLFIVLMVSGVISGPLSIMRGTMLDWLSNGAIWFWGLFF